MSREEVSQRMAALGGVDITDGLALATPPEQGTAGGYWALEEYGLVVNLAFEERSLCNIDYWSTEDFGHSKLRRSESRRSTRIVLVDLRKKTFSVGGSIETEVNAQP